MTEDDAKLYAQDFTQEQLEEIAKLAVLANSKRFHPGAPKAADRLYSYVRGLVRANYRAHREALKRRAA